MFNISLFWKLEIIFVTLLLTKAIFHILARRRSYNVEVEKYIIQKAEQELRDSQNCR